VSAVCNWPAAYEQNLKAEPPELGRPAASETPGEERWAPHPRLVPHDLWFERRTSPSGRVVVALISCERRGCTLNLDTCRACPRFARIDVHEAGYTMLCRSSDEELFE
jgi:hypothetical protein